MIQVYHLRNDLAADATDIVRDVMCGIDLSDNVTILWAADCYEQVADIDSDDLDYAWRWTNNVDTSWSIEPVAGVTVTKPVAIVDGREMGHRSSMVGDVMILNGVSYIVARMGFDRVVLPQVVTTQSGLTAVRDAMRGNAK